MDPDNPPLEAPIPPPGRVLVVEDRPALRSALRDLLFEHGFEVEVAGDGTQALEAVARSEPDVVLMDLRLPGPDGADCTARIKAQAPLVEVIVLSSRQDTGTRKLLQDEGVFRYLVKGVPSREIVETVRQALWHRNMPSAASEA